MTVEDDFQKAQKMVSAAIPMGFPPYPNFYLFKLSGECRFSLVSTQEHKGSVFGYIEGPVLHLYGHKNFHENQGSAWGMNYNQHSRITLNQKTVMVLARL